MCDVPYKDDLVKSVKEVIISIKKLRYNNIFKDDNITNNEKMALYIISKFKKDDKVSLIKLRECLNLAPSTVTPIITSLENKGYIEREIDKNDRRNIYLKLSKIGYEHIKLVDEKLTNSINEYIDFMGYENVENLIKLLNKTNEFVKMKKEEHK